MLNTSVGFAVIGVALLIATVSPLSVARAQDVDAPTVLITGSNRGLGFEFAKQYAAKNWNVIATARNPDAADDLQALAEQYPNVAIEKLDVTDRDMIDALAEKYKDQAIDVLLNNAAILRGPTPDQPWVTSLRRLLTIHFRLQYAYGLFNFWAQPYKSAQMTNGSQYHHQ